MGTLCGYGSSRSAVFIAISATFTSTRMSTQHAWGRALRRVDNRLLDDPNDIFQQNALFRYPKQGQAVVNIRVASRDGASVGAVSTEHLSSHKFFTGRGARAKRTRR